MTTDTKTTIEEKRCRGCDMALVCLTEGIKKLIMQERLLQCNGCNRYFMDTAEGEYKKVSLRCDPPGMAYLTGCHWHTGLMEAEDEWGN